MLHIRLSYIHSLFGSLPSAQVAKKGNSKHCWHYPLLTCHICYFFFHQVHPKQKLKQPILQRWRNWRRQIVDLNWKLKLCLPEIGGCRIWLWYTCIYNTTTYHRWTCIRIKCFVCILSCVCIAPSLFMESFPQ